MNYKALLFPVLKFKEYIIDPDVETDFSGPEIYPCVGVPQKGSSKDKLYSQIALHVEYHKIGENEGRHQNLLAAQIAAATEFIIWAHNLFNL
jgi:hypothetical protein